AHGARNGTVMTRADTSSADTSASAWRSLPAAPSLMTQAEWGGCGIGFAPERSCDYAGDFILSRKCCAHLRFIDNPDTPALARADQRRVIRADPSLDRRPVSSSPATPRIDFRLSGDRGFDHVADLGN